AAGADGAGAVGRAPPVRLRVDHRARVVLHADGRVADDVVVVGDHAARRAGGNDDAAQVADDVVAGEGRRGRRLVEDSAYAAGDVVELEAYVGRRGRGVRHVQALDARVARGLERGAVGVDRVVNDID